MRSCKILGQEEHRNESWGKEKREEGKEKRGKEVGEGEADVDKAEGQRKETSDILNEGQ